MSCDEIRRLLGEHGPGEALPPSVVEHLGSCSECGHVRDEFSKLDEDLAAFYLHGYEPGIVEAALQRIGPGEVQSRRPRRMWFALAAAAFLFVAVGVTLMTRDTGEPSVAGKQAEGEELQGARYWARAGSRVNVLEPRHLKLTAGAVFLRVKPGGGPFRVSVPGGAVTVVGTEFSVNALEAETRVAVREGVVRLENQDGKLELKAGMAGTIRKSTETETGGPPRTIEGVTVAGETLWRPWEDLEADERDERLNHLSAMLSGEDYNGRVAAREVLAGAGEAGIGAAVAWTKAEVPRLRLEAVLFLRRAPKGHAGALKALRAVRANSAEQDGIRDQAGISIERILRGGP